jgi:hypothetical protein
MQETTDGYKCIKVNLDSIIVPNRTDMKFSTVQEFEQSVLGFKTIINSAVSRANKICIQTYMILKYYILYHYQSKLEIPKISVDLIKTIQQSVCINASRGREKKEKNKILFNKFISIGVLLGIELIDGNGLSQILGNQAKEMFTAYENNIKMHFLYEYINRFINAYFQLKKNKKHNDMLKSDLHALKNDIRNGTTECHERYHNWLKKYRYSIVPFHFSKSYEYDIQIHPQKYITHMLWMNEMLEANDFKLFQALPLRTDSIPKHIEIDSKSIVQLFKLPNQNHYYTNITSLQDKLWRVYTYIPRKLKLTKKKYTFDYTIITDGHSCSLRYIELEQLKLNNIKKDNLRKGRKLPEEEKIIKREIRQKMEDENEEIERNEYKNKEALADLGVVFKAEKDVKEKKEKKAKNTEFKYITDVEPNELLNHKGNVVFNDDGKRSLFMMKDKYGNFFNYTNTERLKYTKRLKFQRKIEIEKNKKFNIEGVLTTIKLQEEELSDYNSKTINLEKFIAYCNKKISVNKIVMPEYDKKVYRQYKWYGYINRQRQDTKLANKIEKTFGKDAIIISGDASVSPTMKNMISTPNKRIKRVLRNKIYQIDEFRTSCVNYKNNKYYQKNNLKIKDKKNKLRTLHPVLTYQMENKRVGCINRDKNAVYNMEKIYNHYLEYCKGNITTKRPEIFCREIKLKPSNPRSNRKSSLVPSTG